VNQRDRAVILSLVRTPGGLSPAEPTDVRSMPCTDRAASPEGKRTRRWCPWPELGSTSCGSARPSAWRNATPSGA